MTVLTIILIFTAFCVIAAAIRLAERIAEGAIMRQRQDMLLDAAYSKLVRLAAQAVADWRRITGGGGGND